MTGGSTMKAMIRMGSPQRCREPGPRHGPLVPLVDLSPWRPGQQPIDAFEDLHAVLTTEHPSWKPRRQAGITTRLPLAKRDAHIASQKSEVLLIERPQKMSHTWSPIPQIAAEIGILSTALAEWFPEQAETVDRLAFPACRLDLRRPRRTLFERPGKRFTTPSASLPDLGPRLSLPAAIDGTPAVPAVATDEAWTISVDRRLATTRGTDHSILIFKTG